MMSRQAIGTALAILLVCGEAWASPATFTWDPAQATPPVPGTAFTADAIQTTDFLFNSGDAAGNGTDYFILQINGFSRNGVAVPVAGLNSSYGLYIDLTVATVGSGYGAGTVALRLDPTNNDGTPSATWNAATQTGGVSFANPANTADDVTLATGNFLSGAFGPQSNGRVGAQFVEGFVPNPAESGFFAGTNGIPSNIDEMLFNTPTSRVQGPNNIGGLYTVVNDGFGTVTLQPVPEPTSIAVLGAGLLGLLALSRRW